MEVDVYTLVRHTKCYILKAPFRTPNPESQIYKILVASLRGCKVERGWLHALVVPLQVSVSVSVFAFF